MKQYNDSGVIYAPYIPIILNDIAFDVEKDMSYVGGVLNYKSPYRLEQFFVGYNKEGKFEIRGMYRFTLEQAHDTIPHKHNYETH